MPTKKTYSIEHDALVLCGIDLIPARSGREYVTSIANYITCSSKVIPFAISEGNQTISTPMYGSPFLDVRRPLVKITRAFHISCTVSRCEIHSKSEAILFAAVT
uniref:Uncharacterized protein n=1 Tax=Oryza brachyantha TaxID=4533 RepID=J3N724_ORYBR